MNLRVPRAWPRLLGMLLVVAGLAALWAPAARAQTGTGPVYVIEVHGDIDLGLAPYLSRALKDAENARARAVILDINTPGGRLDAVLQMRDALLDTPLRTVAFVNRTAFSAGALVAISASEIYMTPGGVMGAATPVTGGGETGTPKVISAVRSTFRSTAELRGRDPRLAEAMVDPDVAIEGLVEPGQLLTLTATEARQRGYAEGIVSSRGELLTALDLNGAQVVETGPSLAENLVRFLTNPLVASLLISVGLLLFIGDLLTSGFGLLGVGGLAVLALFFWGHYLAGLAGWEGVALVALGLVLIGVEVFVVPGFGVAGVLGLGALFGGLFLSLVNQDIITRGAVLRAGYTLGLTAVTLLVGVAVLLWYLPRLPWPRGLVLRANVGALEPAGWYRRLANGADDEDTAPHALPRAEAPPLLGATGVALSDLRPGGFARIDGRRVDVVTQGEYITAGEPVEIIADEGYRRVVRRDMAARPIPTSPAIAENGERRASVRPEDSTAQQG